MEGVVPQTRILLVEDDTALLDGMRESLELTGFSVMTAENGEKALDVLEAAVKPGESLPDLIVSDIMMPDMDGYQFLSAVRADDRWMGLPFIFLTAKSARQDIRSGKKKGADDYLTKPFDVAELLDAIESRLKRHAELEKWNETRLVGMKRRILTALNHEFRTPLSYVLAYSDILLNGDRKANSEEMQMYLGEIHRGGERLLRLVEDFLLLVEFETGQAVRTLKLRQEMIPNLKELVRAIVEDYRAECEKTGIELTFEPGEELSPIRGDYQFLKAAIRHLVGNAVKFTEEHGTSIEVALRHHDDEVCIAVTDDGVGIEPEHQASMFELFHQANREHWEQQGVGAGLTIVKHVADLHGGRIVATSEPGKGSCFTLFLPQDGEE